MKKLFNKITDINGTPRRYPIAENGAVFFNTEDNNFLIYALYTKKDLSDKMLIKVDQDVYTSEIEHYRNLHKTEPIQISLPSESAVAGIIAFTQYKSTVDNTSLEDLYYLNYKGD